MATCSTEELELLGRRIDTAALMAQLATSKWSKNHWTIAHRILVRRMEYLTKIRPYINERIPTEPPREEWF